MSADLHSVAKSLGWRVSMKGTSIYRAFHYYTVIIGPRADRWWAGVILSEHPSSEPPAPAWSEFTYATPEQAALEALRGARRWRALRSHLRAAWAANTARRLWLEAEMQRGAAAHPWQHLDDEVFQ